MAHRDKIVDWKSMFSLADFRSSYLHGVNGPHSFVANRMAVERTHGINAINACKQRLTMPSLSLCLRYCSPNGIMCVRENSPAEVRVGCREDRRARVEDRLDAYCSGDQDREPIALMRR